MVFPCGNPGSAFVFGEFPAGSRINRSLTSMRSISGPLRLPKDIIPAAKTGIEEFSVMKVTGDTAVAGTMFALNADGFLPLEAEPGKILVNLLRISGTAASRVNVLNTK